MATNDKTPIQRGRMLAWILVLALVGVGLMTQPAHATLLNPGDEDLTASGEAKPVGGALIAGGIPVPFVALTFSGTLTSSVIQGDTSNPFGGLTFLYQFTNDAKSANSIDRFTIQHPDLPLFLTDGSYQLPGPGLAPTLMGRPTADVVGFQWVGAKVGAGVVTPGTPSAILVVQTDAKAFQVINANLIDGSTANPLSFGPAVPEPSTFALAGLGGAAALAVGVRRRHRRAKAS